MTAGDDKKLNTGIIDALVSLFQRKNGTGAFGHKNSEASQRDRENYAEYLKNTSPTEQELIEQRKRSESWTVRFIVVVAGRGGRKAAATVASIEAQSYRNFLLTDDPFSEPGDFVLTVCEGDTLTPDALYRMAEHIRDDPGARLVYADEDSLAGSERVEPVFKGEYCAATSLSYDMLGAPLAVAKSIYDVCAAPSLESAALPGEAYAFSLRCLAKAGGAGHVPRVLLTRASKPAPVSYSEGAAAIEYYLKQTQQDCSVSAGMWEGSFRVNARVIKKRTAIIIPNLDGAQELRRALESVDETCSFYTPQLIIADAGTTSERTKRYYGILEKNGAAKIVRNAGKSFAALCNAAARVAHADDYIFLSRDAKLYTPDLIGALRAQAYRRNVGAVGPTVTSGAGLLTSCGYAAGLLGSIDSPYAGVDTDELADAGLRALRFTDAVRGVMAVSGVCMMVRADIFHSSGMFDESFDMPGIMPVGADIEFCIRLMRRKLTNIYTPFARVLLDTPLMRVTEACEKTRMRAYDALRPALVEGDPYFSMNWSRETCRVTSGDGTRPSPPEPF